MGLAPYLIDYEHARVLMLQEQWLEATRILELTIPKLHDNSRLFRETNIFVGRCYEQIGENERRLFAYTRALPLKRQIHCG